MFWTKYLSQLSKQLFIWVYQKYIKMFEKYEWNQVGFGGNDWCVTRIIKPKNFSIDFTTYISVYILI